MACIIPPLYEEGDLVAFLGYVRRKFTYWEHKNKWNYILADLGCPKYQINNTLIVLRAISAQELFIKPLKSKLSSSDHGYVVVSQSDGARYFVYEDEIRFLEVNDGNV
jgi:hypothetical protein